MTWSMQEVGLAIKRLQWRHHRESNRRLTAQTGLSLVQWDVLRHLHDAPDSSLHALAVLTFQTDQSMGELARRMTDRGLLTRADTAGRAVRHELTDAGREAFEAGSGILEGVVAETIGRLTDADRTTLYRLLTKASTE